VNCADWTDTEVYLNVILLRLLWRARLFRVLRAYAIDADRYLEELDNEWFYEQEQGRLVADIVSVAKKIREGKP
jgi:hypothetical protein